MTIHNTFMWRKGFILSATFLLALLVFGTSCKKKKNLLGGDTLPPDIELSSGTIDSFELVTYSVVDDSVETINPRYAVLGTMNDETFGVSSASFYTQFKLQSLAYDFGDIGTIAIDSFVLAMEYGDMYGEPSTQTIEIYRVDEQMSLESDYYISTSLNVQAQNWVETGSDTYTFDPNTITVIDNDTVAPQLRVRLDPARAIELMQESQNNPAAFADNDLFSELYKGLYIKTTTPTPNPGEGSVAYFDITDQSSKMTIYYTQDGSQKFFNLNINTDCVDFNHVEFDHSGTDVQAVVDSQDGQEAFYAQAFNLRGVIDISQIADLPSNVIIHSAELLLPIEYQIGTKVTPSSGISVATKEGKEFITFGTYSESGRRYTVDLRQYIQNWSTGENVETELIVAPTVYISSMERIIFNGQSTTNKEKPRLIVTYTEF